MSNWWGIFVEKRIVVNLFKRMIGVVDFRKERNAKKELLEGTILRNEDEVVKYLSGWLTDCDYRVFTKNEFKVWNGHGRPDMVVINEKKGEATAIEVKPSKSGEVFKGSKIIDYARSFCNGAKYIINNSEIVIRNFLIATELSPYGRLIEGDIPLNEKDLKKKMERYREYARRYGKSDFLEPYVEWQRTYDFIRMLWKQWKKEDRILMKIVDIGILLSTKNDLKQQSRLAELPFPKIFVTHFSKKERWVSQWKVM